MIQTKQEYRKYWITEHCRERYIQRVLNNMFLNDKILNVQIIQHILKGTDITEKVGREVPRYILHLYEKYKTTRQRIIQADGVIFIAIKRENTQSLYEVVTCFSDMNFLSQFKNSALSNSEIYIRIAEIKRKLKAA